MAVTFDAATMTVATRREGNAVAGFCSRVGKEAELVLKTGETLTGWAQFFSAVAGNQDAMDMSGRVVGACSLGAKATCFAGAISEFGKTVGSLGRLAGAVERIQSGAADAGGDAAEAAVDAVGSAAKTVAKLGEFTKFLDKMSVTGLSESASMAVSGAIPALKVVGDVAGIVGAGFDISRVVAKHEELAKRRAGEGEPVRPEEEKIHEMKTHESWLGMLKNISALALHVLSFIGIVLGIAFANPILLVIGTVVLVSSIALFFISDDRKNEEQKDVIGKINAALQAV